MTILITRPEPEATSFADLCKSHGLTAITSPLLTIHHLNPVIDLSGIGCLAFTSINGVRAFAQSHTERRLPVFTVGSGSGEAAKGFGFENIRVADGDVESLGHLIAAQHNAEIGAALHCAGATRSGDLVKFLQADNIPARRTVLYEARQNAALSAAAFFAFKVQHSIDWVALFSPRSADLFQDVINSSGLSGELAGVRAACLSDAVSVRLTHSHWKSVDVAVRRDTGAMVELLANA